MPALEQHSPSDESSLQQKLSSLIQSLSAQDSLPSDLDQLLYSEELDLSQPLPNGSTFLHSAVQTGNIPLVQSLLRASHPWNVLDSQNKSVGDIALEQGYKDMYEFLVEEGARTELILSALGFSGRKYEDQDEEEEDTGPVNREYLESKLRFEEGRLVDEEANGVMMGW